MTALPPGVREETHDYIEEDSARASLFPPEPIKSAAPFQLHEVGVPAPTPTRHTTDTTITNTGGDGSDSPDIPF